MTQDNAIFLPWSDLMTPNLGLLFREDTFVVCTHWFSCVKVNQNAPVSIVTFRTPDVAVEPAPCGDWVCTSVCSLKGDEDTDEKVRTDPSTNTDQEV